MVSNAFRSAAMEETNQQTKFANNISSGIKDIATAIAGVAGFAGLARSGNLLASAAAHTFAGRVGGIGGNIMLANLQERKQMAMQQKQRQDVLKQGIQYTADLVNETLSQNVIDRHAKNQLSTVFEKLTQKYDQGIVNKSGKIATSMGDIDMSSPLGQKILKEGDTENDNDQ